MNRIGIDIGGTAVKLGVVNKARKIIGYKTFSTSGFPKADLVSRQIAGAALELARTHQVASVGVGVAGDIDFKRQLIRVSPNLGWKNVPFKELLRKGLLQRGLDFPIVIDNDANAAAWGIYKTQAPSSVKNMIVMTLGTGIGGGLILNGELYRGATGSAGEIGHTIMDEKGRRCNCGNRGCLETYAGAFHLTNRIKEDLKKGARSSLQTLYRKDPSLITPETLSDAARHGDRYALGVWNELGHLLGLALGNLMYAFNPDLIILTGGVSQAGKLLISPIQKTVQKRTFKTIVRAAKIKVAKDAPHIGLIGAALLA